MSSDPVALIAAGPTALDGRLGGPMFWLTLLYLALTAGALHIGAEAALVEALDGRAGSVAAGPVIGTMSQRVGQWCAWGLVLLYPAFVAEGVWHWRGGGRNLRQHVWFCLLPPLRLGARDHAEGHCVWLPRVGWQRVDDLLRRRVERSAHTPMLAVALLVLPLLAAQHYLHEHVRHSGWLAGAVEAGAAVIWLAFTVEFIVMAAIAPRRWTYARQHWLDLLIICFPLVAFLRFARVAGTLRVLRLGRLQQVFRLRGTLMRLWRAVLLLELLERVFRRPEQRLASLRERVAARELEIAELRREIAEIERRVAEAAALRDQTPQAAAPDCGDAA